MPDALDPSPEAGVAPAPADPQWECDAGLVLGWRDEGVLRATGIRYARAERYQSPQPEPPSPHPIDATSWSPACPQAPIPALEEIVGGQVAALDFDEDCQRLSLTLPPDVAPGEALPVMVWIHGGSYVSGAGDAPHYDPAALVREQRVIVVTVTYRLGMLGYLRGPYGEAANLGLLDQLEALRWVQRNVAAFGGDPRCVTVFGESAGGDAVVHLMATPEAKGVMRRGIVQSAPFGIVRGRAEMAELMRATAAATVEDDAPVDDVVAAQARVEKAVRRFGLRGAMAFGVQPGVDPLPGEEALDEAWRAAAPEIDLLVGCTAREAALFVDRIPPLRTARRVPGLRRTLERRVVGPLTETIYARGARELAAAHRAAGGRATRYTLTWHSPGNPFAAAHTSDLPLIFGGPGWRGTPLVAGTDWAQVQQKGARLRALWADFARTGTLSAQVLDDLVTIHPNEADRGAHSSP